MYTQTKHTHRTQHINYTINLQKVQKILNKKGKLIQLGLTSFFHAIKSKYTKMIIS
jgi:hypothetical protein